MHRRRGHIGIFAALVLIVGGAAALFGVVGAAVAPGVAASDQPNLTAQIGDAPTGQAMAPGFLGVSFEYRAMHLYTGRDPRTINPVLLSLLRALAPGHSPVLRIGGDSTDGTWWPVRGVIRPGGIYYDLSNGWLRTTQALAAALNARLILGINLATDRPDLAAAEARAIVHGIGARYIKALEIGNEPDLYGSFAFFRDRRGRVVFARSRQYDLGAFIQDFSRWRAALPSVPLAGPTFSSLSWMPGLDTFLSSEPGVGVVTFHRYPLRGCVNNAADPSFASIPNLLSDSASAGLAHGVAPYVGTAHAHGLPFRLDELNSAACSGRWGVSNTFASSLWLLDTLFNMASVGVDGVNLHTLPGAAYEPFTFSHRGNRWTAFVRPSYYAALMFNQAFPVGARLLPVTSPDGPVKVWATLGADGRTRVVLINKESGTPVQMQLQLPGAQTPASMESLSSPDVSATTGVSLGGQTFGAQTHTGLLPAQPRDSTVDPSGGAYTVELPPASAVLVTR